MKAADSVVRTSSELSQGRGRLILSHPHRHPRRTRTKTTWPVFHDVLLFATEDESVTTDSRLKHWWALRLQENISSPELIIEMFPPSSLEPTLGTGRDPLDRGSLRPNYFDFGQRRVSLSEMYRGYSAPSHASEGKSSKPSLTLPQPLKSHRDRARSPSLTDVGVKILNLPNEKRRQRS